MSSMNRIRRINRIFIAFTQKLSIGNTNLAMDICWEAEKGRIVHFRT